MISKSKISKIRLLHQKKHREEMQLFLVEGTKSVIEVLNSKLEVDEIFATEKWQHQNAVDFDVITVSESEMERMSCMKTPPEILCTVKIPHFDLKKIEKNAPILLLDGIKDPGNLGTIIRTGEWLGFQQIVCSLDSVEFTNPKTIQACMGSFCRSKIYYCNLTEFIKSEKDRKIYGLCMNGTDITNINFKNNDILVVGSESHGISPEVMQLLSEKIHISAAPNNCAESLNASIAAAIVMFQHYKLR